MCMGLPGLVGYSYQGLMATRQTTLEYLTTTKIGEKGQLTVPKQFRKDLGLSTGAPFAVLRLGDGLVLLPEQQRLSVSAIRLGPRSHVLVSRRRHYWRHCPRHENASTHDAMVRPSLPEDVTPFISTTS